ncbi:NTP transferase domain-containing protein, partial [Halopenitus sp. POP-27]|uniref:NTP transferase domain-containing protein n=1 Tax=Halopenitus sp. POP-27 TaxID=2994425 RepID=UPI002AA2B067
VPPYPAASLADVPFPPIVLCGGRGTRLAGEPTVDAIAEKPLVRVGGEPMVDRVVRALRRSDAVDAIHAVASPHTPETLAHLRSGIDSLDVPDGGDGLDHPVDRDDRPVLTVREGSGDGYVADLQAALENVDPPAITAVADLPLLRPDHVSAAVNHAIRRSDGESLTVCVPASTKRDLGVSADTTMTVDGMQVAPTGLNVVGSEDAPETVRVVDDPALAINVNRPGDLRIARKRVASSPDGC